MRKERFTVTYRLSGNENDCKERAKGILLEQTVELPDHLVPNGFIRDEVIGQIEFFSQIDELTWDYTISYLADSSAFELTQLLNIIFGNSSIKEKIRVEDISLGPELSEHFNGPRLGIAGMRDIVGVYDKPLICSALKPMGFSAEQLADLAYKFAIGGIDFIKDDHGLSNQPFCKFEERVKACVEAVNRANEKTGKRCVYAPNVTASITDTVSRIRFAKKEGAGAVLMMPGLAGFDTMRSLADMDEIALPIISHPALLGPMVTCSNNGFSHRTIFGKLQRLAGADSSVYPNYGGRFGFSKGECQSIDHGCKETMGNLKSIFPSPGGGMSMDRVPEMLKVYGNDVMFLIGGDLFNRSSDLTDNARCFLSLVGRD
ncbi:ribulose 1,5-bisphosphate carboxylase large subunit [bacterium]|nr:ribulose 1,5-bisphosphate carboxylase large subunit [bacterium]